ncbi:50S ribosome-binding GTPase [Streptomyces celluloflavus]|nr:50S ribosome-binding GTPase [Streptomyces celluloflavus]
MSAAMGYTDAEAGADPPMGHSGRAYPVGDAENGRNAKDPKDPRDSKGLAGAKSLEDMVQSLGSEGGRSPVAGAADGGAWDDGVIARRARTGEFPRPARQRGMSSLLEAELEEAARWLDPLGAEPRGAGVQVSGAPPWDVGQGEAQGSGTGFEPGWRGERRATGEDEGAARSAGAGAGGAGAEAGTYEASAGGSRCGAGDALLLRLDALRELIELSRTRLDGRTLAEAGRVLDAAVERHRLSGEFTVVAIAGATGSGKSSLFNALAGANRSSVGVRRPTTCEPVACVWSGDGPGDRPGAEGLLNRLDVPLRRRHLPVDAAPELRGLLLLDLPDHDSAATGNRAQVDRMLDLVDAVIWVVDPEKYADAVLHERYLRPLAGHAEVTFVVLNQVDRLPGEAADQVVDDLRRLLDEDGLALGEHGEPGATVLALSAATGKGVGELREALGQFVAERGAADRRLAADVDAAAERLRSAYVAARRVGLTEEARAEFDDRLAEAVGAAATGRTAERDWLRQTAWVCGSPWTRLSGGRTGRWAWEGPARGARKRGGRLNGGRTGLGRTAGGAAGAGYEVTGAAGRAAARPVVEQAVRIVAGEAACGLPEPWAQAVREAAERGAEGLPEALDKAAADAETSLRGGPAVKPRWWTVAAALQGLLFVLQVAGVLWLLGVVTGVTDTTGWLAALLPAVIGSAGGPALAWLCRMGARGPARRYGQEAERRLRSTAAGCGRARVLKPVTAELKRYQEVRERYAVASGA